MTIVILRSFFIWRSIVSSFWVLLHDVCIFFRQPQVLFDGTLCIHFTMSFLVIRVVSIFCHCTFFCSLWHLFFCTLMLCFCRLAVTFCRPIYFFKMKSTMCILVLGLFFFLFALIELFGNSAFLWDATVNHKSSFCP